jgi:hypothetical protein
VKPRRQYAGRPGSAKLGAPHVFRGRGRGGPDHCNGAWGNNCTDRIAYALNSIEGDGCEIPTNANPERVWPQTSPPLLYLHRQGQGPMARAAMQAAKLIAVRRPKKIGSLQEPSTGRGCLGLSMRLFPQDGRRAVPRCLQSYPGETGAVLATTAFKMKIKAKSAQAWHLRKRPVWRSKPNAATR